MLWAFAGAAIALLYWFAVRRSFARWGATSAEVSRVMRGDSLIAAPSHSATQAISVNAPPEDIWPWLVQMGYQRGGLYSYDWLDRLFGILDRPSATRILPDCQTLEAGDYVWLGPDDRSRLTVKAVEPPRALALSYERGGFQWVWQFGLYPIDADRTRFVTRGIEHVPNGVVMWLFMRLMEPAAFIMTRRMLRGVKTRAERLHAIHTADRGMQRHAA
jgi:hypothetical protein